ncbi:hypothetical protein P5491_012830 [Priestia megaterium]|uniref:hypothetical protein n=1 Tax=Priestia megaterium TaxID=1404 RepID=UPI002452C881|nr:hypothetical protein [Priestia megaterium]MDH3141991.1 hypothetical protein [Priestia megaterium]
MFDKVNKISFQKRPIPLSADYRPLYKIIQLLLVLNVCSHQETASLLKLHLFSWMMSTKEGMDKITQLIVDNRLEKIPLWRLEPSLNRALNFAVGENLLMQKNGKYKLSEKGKILVQDVLKDKELMKIEKTFLTTVGKKITEKKVKELSEKWGGK